MYKIMRQIEPETGWHFVDAVHFRETVLTGQPQGQTFKFRIIASNKAGEGTPSNSVVAKL